YESRVMTRLAGKKHPAPAKYAPALTAVRSLRPRACSLSAIGRLRGAAKSSRAFFEKSKSKKPPLI
ncbi:MAG: hypothetical protein WCL34_12200, partial [Methylococcaceae bacterium]